MRMTKTRASIAILTVAGLALAGCARGGDTATDAEPAEALQSDLAITTPPPTGEIDKILGRHLDPAQGGFWTGDAANIDDIDATGDHEVTVTLKEPDSLFTDKLLTPLGPVVRARRAGSPSCERRGTASQSSRGPRADRGRPFRSAQAASRR